MNIYLFTRSSFTHDLSNLLYLRDSEISFKNSLVFLFSFSGNIYFNNNNYFLNEYRSIVPPFKIINLKFTSKYSRIALLFFLVTFHLFNKIPFINTILIQPSPSWLYQRFGFLSSIIPRFYSHLVGDGVGCETLDSTPMWLSHIYKNSPRAHILSSSYVFSLVEELEAYDFSRKCYSTIHLNEVISSSFSFFRHTVLHQALSPVFRLTECKMLIVLTGSTFTENSRMTLENELSLYGKVFSKISDEFILSSSHPIILFKPHPLTSAEKLFHLVELQSRYLNLPTSTLQHLFSILTCVPLEILFDYLFSQYPDINLTLFSASAACVPSAVAFPSMETRILFGSMLTKELFMDSVHYDNRVIQEDRLQAVMSDLK